MNLFFTTLLITIIIVAFSIFILGFRIWLFKDKKFPNIHIEENKALKDKGITCALDDQDKREEKS